MKEVLCELNPEALEEIERDCEQKNNAHSDSNQEGGRERKGEPTKAIKKKNDKKKKRKDRFVYD